MKRILNLKYGLAASVALLAFFVYLPALQNDFVEWDDNQYVFENPYIRSISPAFFRWAFTAFHASNWHPLTWISHALDYSVWGLNPLGHHLTNNILHAVNTFLVMLLIIRLLASRQADKPASSDDSLFTIHDSRFALIAAATTGLLFGLHPIHVESVAWVSERKDLLCAFFYLLSVMAYTEYAGGITPPPPSYRKRGWRSRRRYLLSLLFFILALLSKPMAVGLPVVLLLLDWFPFGRVRSFRAFRDAFAEKLPFIALSVGSSVLTVLAQRDVMGLMESVQLPTRLLVAAKSLISYLWKMLLPLNLVPYYPYPDDISFLAPEYFGAVLLVIGITAAGMLAVRKQRIWITAWGYYVISLLPVLGILQVGSQAMADRYTYLPSIGPFLVVGIGSARLYMKYGRLEKKGLFLKLLSIGVVVFLLLAMSYLTIRQTGVWRNSITLWSYVIEKEPERGHFAYNNRGLAFSRAGEFDRAIGDFRKAIALNPRYADAHSNLGVVFSKRGWLKQAIDEYMIAIRLNPRFVAAHQNLASALFTSGRFAEALEHYLVVTGLRPDDAGAHVDVGSAYGEMRMFDKAIEHFQIALRLDPDHPGAHYNLATAYGLIGDMVKAKEHYEAALRLNPKDTGFRNAPMQP